jgi:hypothetical protein
MTAVHAFAGSNADIAVNDVAPSFTINLYPEHWTLNNGSKFLYNNPVAVGGLIAGVTFVLLFTF